MIINDINIYVKPAQRLNSLFDQSRKKATLHAQVRASRGSYHPAK